MATGSILHRFERLGERFGDWLGERLGDWLGERLGEWLRERLKERMEERVGDLSGESFEDPVFEDPVFEVLCDEVESVSEVFSAQISSSITRRSSSEE